MPAWLAVTPQVPILVKVTTFPEMLQVPFWTILKLTARPELAVALSVNLRPSIWAGMALKVMTCDLSVAVTVKLCVTGVAALYTLLPGCEATIVQVPAASKVAVLPETVQTLLVEELKLTLRPELAVAVNATVVPLALLPGAANVIVCAAGLFTTTICPTAGAAL